MNVAECKSGAWKGGVLEHFSDFAHVIPHSIDYSNNLTKETSLILRTTPVLYVSPYIYKARMIPRPFNSEPHAYWSSMTCKYFFSSLFSFSDMGGRS